MMGIYTPRTAPVNAPLTSRADGPAASPLADTGEVSATTTRRVVVLRVIGGFS
jgi:hypothetical protein